MSLEQYDVIKTVGKGSYGEVWLVKQKKDKKQFVIKKMELRNASKREKKAAEQEAKLLSKLRHPNIVSYRDSFNSEDGHLYIVMGYCDGGDLYNKLKMQKGLMLEERQVVEWFVQIAMALQYMHERNILHRDLKTQNIFLTKSKIIKVGDLGIARVLDGSNDMATTLIGTPYYMSPELFSNRPYNHKSDVWALGCCVYEMATLKHAFNAKDMNSLVYKILRGKMPAMPQQFSKELVELIKASLNQSPEKRPSVARILRNPYIKRHIALFLEGTRARRPSSGSSERRRGSRPEIIELQAEASSRAETPRTAIVEGKEDPGHGALTPITEVSTKDSGVSSRPSSGGDASKRSSQSSARKSSVKKPSSYDVASPRAGSESSSTPRKGRPLPQPPNKAGTPRTSSSYKKRSGSAPSSAKSSSSSSSSVGSSKEDNSTPRDSQRSINTPARARRRELRESQEHGTPPLPPKARSSNEDSRSAGKDDVDSGPTQKVVVRSHSDPSLPSKKHDSGGTDRQDTDNSSSSGEEEEEGAEGSAEGAKKREAKEMAKFSSLLETTLRLEGGKKKGGKDSPDESDVGRDSPDAPTPKDAEGDISIEPAAPRAPKGIGNATMTTSGRLMDRIGALRKDIMQGIGIEVLQKAYEILDNEEGDDIEPMMVKLMGKRQFDIYGGKIWQLKFCEETVFG